MAKMFRFNKLSHIHERKIAEPRAHQQHLFGPGCAVGYLFGVPRPGEASGPILAPESSIGLVGGAGSAERVSQ